MGTLVGMGMKMGITRIDERGRVTLPQDLRQELALTPGDPVLVERTEGGVVVKKVHSKKEVFQKLRGIVTARNAVGKLDPMDLKRLLRASD